MNKILSTFSKSLFAMIFVLFGSFAWGQSLIYSTGFENSEGFNNSNTYNNSTVAYTGPSSQQWGTYYGTPSTTSALIGSQSMQMRWYTSAPSNNGYTFTNFDLQNVTSVDFSAQNTNGINVIVSYSTDGGSTYVNPETFTLSTSTSTHTYNVSPTGAFPNVRLKFEITYSSNPSTTSRLYLDNIEVYGMNSSPSISSSSSSITGLDYTTNSGPSTAQTFSVTGSNLTTDITVSAPTNFEVSDALGGTYTSTITLPSTGGDVYTRLVAGLTANTYTGDITLSSTGASDVTVSVEGTVSDPVVTPPVANPATNILTNGFTANWDAVSGADSYVLEVYEGVGLSDLIISEYVEGSSNNKYIEIFNGTGAPVDLSGYSLELYTNGDTTDGSPQVLSGTLNNGEVVVYAHSSANIYSGTTQASTKTLFNGDDAIALLKGGMYVDIFGKIGEDPGSQWSDGGNSTQDQTLVRNSNVTAGVTTNPTNSFETLATEWTSFAQDNVSNLGSHTANIGTLVSSQNVGNVTTFDVTNLTPDTDYYYVVRTVDNTFESSNSNSIAVKTLSLMTTWDGTTWDNGTPTSTADAFIAGNYSGVSFETKDLTINSGFTLTIASDESVTANGVVTNEGSIMVSNDGNFIQATGSTYTGTGTFTLNRETTGEVNKYSGWSSPVQGQNMYNIYGTSGTPQYVMTYNSDTDYYNTETNPATATAGVGYAVKIPVTAATATFEGTPNNGDVTVTMDNTANANGNMFNYVGNPYPSNFSLANFYTENSSNVGSTFYFWDNKANTSTTQTGSQTTVIGWAYYNAASGTWTPATSSSYTPTGTTIKPGQAFVVSATTTAATMTNAMRVETTPASFFNKGFNTGEGKFWLKLTTPYNAHNTLAITYGNGAQNIVDPHDSKLNGIGSDAFYSFVGNDKFSIQGRDTFVNTDIVPLGNKHFEAGTHTISLVDTEGLFDGAQVIILRDKELNIETDLKLSNYTFQANAGEFNNRFEVIYQPNHILATSETETTDAFDLYKEDHHFVVVGKENIDGIEVYDASGRLVLTQTPKARKSILNIAGKGVFVVKITSNGNVVSKKIVK